MKVDQHLQHAPDTTSDSFNDKVCGALVHTLEFLFPPLKRSLAWDRSEFEPMFPDWYMSPHAKHDISAATATTTTTAATAAASTPENTSATAVTTATGATPKTSAVDSSASAHTDVISQQPQHIASRAA